MPLSRDLGTVPVGATNAGTFIERTCISIKFAAGYVNLTNHPCPIVNLNLDLNLDGTPDGAKDYNAISLNLDGTSRYYLQYGFTLGEITESSQDGKSASWLQFDNVAADNNYQDRQFTKWANSPGLRKVAVDVYSVHFDPATDAYLGSYLLFPGEFDGGEFGDIAQITLKMRDTPWAVQMLHKVNGSCASLRNYRGVDCGYAGAEPVGQVTCSGSLGDCTLRGNQARHNGHTKLPKPGINIVWPI